MSIDQPEKAQISHILGIDFGTSKVGLAMADFETKIASAYATLKNDKTFLRALEEIIKKENVSEVIIGIPSHVNRQSVEYAGEKLGKAIKDIFPGIIIEYQDEMFTTKMAEENLKSRGIRKIKRFDDQEAARIILQSWLDR